MEDLLFKDQDFLADGPADLFGKVLPHRPGARRIDHSRR